jgi:hypothetical protein
VDVIPGDYDAAGRFHRKPIPIHRPAAILRNDLALLTPRSVRAVHGLAPTPLPGGQQREKTP